MAKVFLDANFLIDIVEQRRDDINLESLAPHVVFISPLSIHILLYVGKKKVPYEKLLPILDKFYLASLNEAVSQKALWGPKEDFEDNVQLHSAIESGCAFFMTHDQQLLKMKFFGKARIVEILPN